MQTVPAFPPVPAATIPAAPLTPSPAQQARPDVATVASRPPPTIEAPPQRPTTLGSAAGVSQSPATAPVETGAWSAGRRVVASHAQDSRRGEGNGIPHGLRTLLGRGIGIDESRIPEHVSNLDRLGILRIEWGMSTTADYHAYDRIEELVKVELASATDRDLSLKAGVVLVTAFGAQFLETCVSVRVPAARYG